MRYMRDWFDGVRRAAAKGGRGALAISLLAGVLFLGAGPASALTIPGLGDIEPAYFLPKNQFGLAPGQGLTTDITIPPTMPQIRICNLASAACTNPDIAVTQTLGTIYQRPQDNGVTPSPAFPYVADVTFTFERITPPPRGGYCDEYYDDGECGQIDPVLLAFAGFVDPYSGAPALALDLGSAGGVTPLLVLERLTGGVMKQFPAYLLPGLDVGEQTSIVVRYVVGGAMQPNVLGGYDLPGIALTGFQVPEPSTGVLLFGGLVSVVVGAQRRRNRR